MKLHGPVLEHAWSPTDPYLAFYVPEHGQIPARVILREMPSKKLVGQQAMFNVTGVRHYSNSNNNTINYSYTHLQFSVKILCMKLRLKDDATPIYPCTSIATQLSSVM